jgi:glycosyltransferase involved in cell wall biosynthesis
MIVNSNVTVIIPCYNDGQFVLEALESIYSQTVLPEKIIIVDDGSDVETQNILKAICNPIAQVIHQENKGVSNARNTAIALSQTDYILNLDADDYFESSYIEKAVNILNENENIGVVGCLVKILRGNIFEEEIKKPLGGSIKDFVVKNNGISGSMFRKKCWLEVRGYDEKMANGYEDWEFWIAILKRDWIMYILQEPLFIYRQKPMSRDQIALNSYDYELRKYIFLKHKEVYETHFEFYTLEILRQNSVLKNNIKKAKNSLNHSVGQFLLTPFRFLKNKVVK